jgi:hypothetical protein
MAGCGDVDGVAVSVPTSQSFLTGVVDEARQLAFIPTPKGEIVAVDLAGGRELWRGAEGQRPLLIVEDRLLTLAVGSAGASVRQLALETGMPAGSEISLPLPVWVADREARLTVEAEIVPGGIGLVWQAWAGYTGGAPPPPAVRAASHKEAGGRLRVDLERAIAREFPGPPEPARPETVDITAVPPSPGGLAEARLGAASYSLRPGGGRDAPPRLVLEARDATGALLWALTVDETLPIRPPPLRR